MALTLNPDPPNLSPTLIRRALLHAPPARLLLRVRSITFAQQDELSFYYHVPFHMLTSWASPSGPHLPCAYYALTTYRVRTVYGRHRPRLAGCAATRIAAGGRRRGAPHRVRGDAGMHVHCSMRTAHCTLHKRDTHAAHTRTRACACARAACACARACARHACARHACCRRTSARSYAACCVRWAWRRPPSRRPPCTARWSRREVVLDVCSKRTIRTMLPSPIRQAYRPL